MAMELFYAAVVGPSAGELLKKICDYRKATANFRSQFDSLETTIKSVVKQVENIQRLNGEQDLPCSEFEPLVSRLKEGKALVDRCADVHDLNIYRKRQYSKKILKLDEEIRRFLDCDLPVIVARYVKELHKDVKEVKEDVKEVKELLTKDRESVPVVSAPVGRGKTTPAAAPRRERDLRGMASPDYMTILLFHGGFFDSGCSLHYLNGNMSEVEVDPDKLSYIKLLDIIRDKGYNNDAKLFFRIPGKILDYGLMFIHPGNESIGYLISYLYEWRNIEVYVESSANISTS